MVGGRGQLIYGVVTDEIRREKACGFGVRNLDTNRVEYISEEELLRKVLYKEIHLYNYKVLSNKLVKIEEDNESAKDDIEYLLMNRDKAIGEFGLYTGNLNVYENEVRPYNLDSINLWINERLMISCARDTHMFFRELGVVGKRALVENSHCVSLHDNFWIKEKESGLTWKYVSPWRKEEYSERINRYALEDNLLKIEEDSLYSPVIGEEGSFPHMVEKRGSGVYFIKASSKYTLGGVNCGNEPYSEYFASKVCEYLKFDSIKYDIKEHLRNDKKVDIITSCKYFTNEDIGSIPSSSLGLRTYEGLIEYCKELSDKALKKCLDMLFLDCLLMSVDRHFNNVKFLIDNKTLKVLDMAPIFDNNCSLLPWFMPEYDKFVRDSYVARDGKSFEELYKLILKYKSYKVELDKLEKGFKFSASKKASISKERLKFLNDFLNEQVRYWLDFEEKNG